MYILFSIILFIKKKGEKRIRVTTNTHDTHTSNRPIVRTRILSKQVSQGAQSSATIRSIGVIWEVDL